MKALLVIRQSSTTDDAASPESQIKSTASFAQGVRSWDIAGQAVDLDTSASIPPRKRPELGAWLADPDAFDVLVVWRLDRLARSTLDFAELLRWAKDHNKTIVSVTEGFDLSTPVGAMTAQILMVFAEFELASIQQRTAATRALLKQSGRYPGGHVPYGYRPVKRNGAGWELEEDPEKAEILREAATRIASGESTGSVTADFNARGVEPSRGAKYWRTKTLTRMLTSYVVRGYVMEQVKGPDGKRAAESTPVLDETGKPVVRGPAILDAPTFRAVREALQERSRPEIQPRRRAGTGTMHHVAFCAECSEPLYRQRKQVRGKTQDRYACKAIDPIHRVVTAPSVDTDTVVEHVSAWFLRRYGHMEWSTPQYDPGEDHTAALEEIEERISRLHQDRYVRGLFSGERGDREFTSIMKGLEAERERLASLPNREPSTELVPTGRTVAEEWEARGAPGRAELLRSYRVEAILHNAGGSNRWMPLSERLYVHIRPFQSQEEADEAAAWEVELGEMD